MKIDWSTVHPRENEKKKLLHILRKWKARRNEGRRLQLTFSLFGMMLQLYRRTIAKARALRGLSRSDKCGQERGHKYNDFPTWVNSSVRTRNRTSSCRAREKVASSASLPSPASETPPSFSSLFPSSGSGQDHIHSPRTLPAMVNAAAAGGAGVVVERWE